LNKKTNHTDAGAGYRSGWKHFIAIPEVSILIPLIILVGTVTAINPVFLNPNNLGSLARMMAAFGLLAIGQTFIILIGEIDISIGSMVSFASMFFAFLIVELGFPLYFSIIITLLLTVGLSMINGLFIVLCQYARLIIN